MWLLISSWDFYSEPESKKNCWDTDMDFKSWCLLIQKNLSTLNDVARKIELHNGDCISLNVTEGHVTELHTSNHINVRFEGTVKELTIGPSGFERDFRPAFIDYLYHNERLALFWSAVVFLWGMLWSIRKIFFAQ